MSTSSLRPIEATFQEQEQPGTVQRFPTQPELDIGYSSHQGHNPRYTINEDHCSVVQKSDSSGQLLCTLAVVADGIGGMAYGEVASGSAARVWTDATIPHTAIRDASTQADWTNELAWRANKAVIERLGVGRGGSTLSAALFVGNRFTIAHVGDSRAYLITADRRLVQLTNDHSLVAAMVASGVLTSAEAETSSARNQILRSLGAVENYQSNYIDDLSHRHGLTGKRAYALEPGEALLLVSDGVWGELPTNDFSNIVRGNTGAAALCEALVAGALEAGGSDNASAAVVARCFSEEAPRNNPSAP
jgi:PPM family protein phosphatase